MKLVKKTPKYVGKYIAKYNIKSSGVIIKNVSEIAPLPAAKANSAGEGEEILRPSDGRKTDTTSC